MVPPPDNPGDELPDFDSMTFEQQMAWLESLARRQGASEEEFTTAADMDIPEVSPDVVIDEPGYVPYSISEGERPVSSKRAKPEPAPESVEPTPAVEAPPPAEFAPPAEVEEAAFEEPVEMADPMSWLDSLSAHPGDILSETSEALEPQFDFGLEEFDLGMPEEPAADLFAELETASATPQAEPAPAAEDDPLGGLDPMLWLESLAARQGANPDELTTSANLDIPEVSPDVVIDEPGYVPYDVLSDGRRPEVSVSEPEPERVEPPPPVAQEPTPMTEEVPAELGAMDESLSWLEDLAAPDVDMSELLSLGGEFLEVEEPPAPQPERKPAGGDPLAGLTDEQIAYMQAHHQLTGEQELAWLQRQAAKLAEARQQAEQAAEFSLEELPPAEPGELPPWLQQLREEEPTIDLFGAAEELPLVPDIPEVTDWLAEPAPEETGVPELSLGADVDTLWAEPSAEVESAADLGIESELEAFLAGKFVPEEPDQLAEALDAEFERRQSGDETEPEWYTEAVAKGAAALPEVQEAPAAPQASEEPVLAEATPVDMPDWLKETTEEPASMEAAIPSWLTEDVEAAPAVEAEGMPDWLTEIAAEVPEVEWIPMAEKPQAPLAEVPPPTAPVVPPPTPVVVAEPAEPPAPPKQPVIPQGELFDKYQQRLQADPNDYPTRLALARALRTNQQLGASLDQYEVLIDAMQLLQDVSDDLIGMTREQPGDPRMRRLLGDVYMRRGMLQKALEAYRSALEQL